MGEGGDSEGDDSGGEGDGSGGEGDGSGGKGDGSGGEGDRALMGVDHEARGKQALQLLGVDRVVHEERVLPPLVVHEAAWGRPEHHTQCAPSWQDLQDSVVRPGLPKDTCGGEAGYTRAVPLYKTLSNNTTKQSGAQNKRHHRHRSHHPSSTKAAHKWGLPETVQVAGHRPSSGRHGAQPAFVRRQAPCRHS